MLLEPNEMSLERKLAADLGIPAHRVCVVGSTLITGKGNDVDYLVLTPKEETLTKAGFIPDIEVAYESPLKSWRRGEQNIIHVTELEFFLAELTIANAAKLLNSGAYETKTRDGRIRFHSYLRTTAMFRAEAIKGEAP